MSSTADALKAYLLTNPGKPQALEAFAELSDWLSSRGQLAGADLNINAAAIRAAAPQRIIVLGGDGTILAVGRDVLPTRIPIVGVNLGKLGYLAAYSTAEIREHLDETLARPELVSSRMTLEVSVADSSGGRHRVHAINDCVVHAGPPFRMLTLDVAADGYRLTTITADGLIVSTPTGSTAHSMAAGGPVVEPEVEAIVMTSICPHSFAHRPVVMAATTVLTVTVVAAQEGSTAMIDGQVAIPMHAGTVVTLRRGGLPFQLVRHPQRSSWQALVYKLKWGDRPA